MTLGEKLQQTLNELEQAKINDLKAKAAADLEKVRKERKDIDDFLSNMTSLFTEQIESGKVPYKKIKEYNRQKWFRQAQVGKAAHQDMWSGFKQYWAKEGLSPQWTEDHDGMGAESWINMTLVVLPKNYRGM